MFMMGRHARSNLTRNQTGYMDTGYLELQVALKGTGSTIRPWKQRSLALDFSSYQHPIQPPRPQCHLGAYGFNLMPPLVGC